MEWKDPENTGTNPEKSDPYYNDDGYGAPPKKGAAGLLAGHPFRFLYAGVGVAVIIGGILLAVMIFSGDSVSEDAARIAALQERVEELEKRLEKVSQASADQGRTLETLKRSEAAAALRMDHITTSLDSLQKQRDAVPQRTIVTLPSTLPSSSGKTETEKPVPPAPVTQKPTPTKPIATKPATPQPTAAPPPAAAKPAATRSTVTPPPATPTARPTPAGTVSQIHVVVKGDTLYNISRRYNLTVQQLRTLNNLGDDAVIRMGQKLVVQPASTP